MGLKTIWTKYRVLIVMIPGLALVHWGWYGIKSNPIFHQKKEEFVPEPAIVTYVLEQEKKAKGK